MEKLNLTQQKHTFTNQKKRTTQNKHKLKPGLVTYYDIQLRNGEGLFWFRRFINLSLTYLLRHLPTYLQPRSHTGQMPPNININQIQLCSGYHINFAAFNNILTFLMTAKSEETFQRNKRGELVTVDHYAVRGLTQKLGRICAAECRNDITHPTNCT